MQMHLLPLARAFFRQPLDPSKVVLPTWFTLPG